MSFCQFFKHHFSVYKFNVYSVRLRSFSVVYSHKFFREGEAIFTRSLHNTYKNTT